MLLKKGFKYSSSSRPCNLDSYYSYYNLDKIIISFTRYEYNCLCNCLCRLKEVEPELKFYIKESDNLVHELFSFTD